MVPSLSLLPAASLPDCDHTGIHEILHRQGLLKGIWCLNPDEVLSEGQSEEIDRIYKMYPHLNDDAFVKEFIKRYEKI